MPSQVTTSPSAEEPTTPTRSDWLDAIERSVKLVHENSEKALQDARRLRELICGDSEEEEDGHY